MEKITICKNSKGFTLVEIIITFVILSIASTMFVTLFSDNIAKSGEPVIMVKNQYGNDKPDGLVGIIERMTFDWHTDRTSFYTKIPQSTSNYNNTSTPRKVTTAFKFSDSTTGATYMKVEIKKGDQKLIVLFPEQ